MKISGQTKMGTSFTIELGVRAITEIQRTPNQNPDGLTVEEEMTEHIKMYLEGLELAFVAPEPMRRSFVGVFRKNAGDLARKLRENLAIVAEVFRSRVASRQ